MPPRNVAPIAPSEAEADHVKPEKEILRIVGIHLLRTFVPS